MYRLPKWALVNPFPAVHDFESLTAIQQTARVYGAMNELIKEYNAFADQLNKEIEEFTGSSEKEISEFKESIETRIRCKFELMDAAYTKMKVDIATHADTKIEEIYEKYLGEYATNRISEIINQKIASGEIEITLVYDPVTENLAIAPAEV